MVLCGALTAKCTGVALRNHKLIDGATDFDVVSQRPSAPGVGQVAVDRRPAPVEVLVGAPTAQTQPRVSKQPARKQVEFVCGRFMARKLSSEALSSNPSPFPQATRLKSN